MIDEQLVQISREIIWCSICIVLFQTAMFGLVLWYLGDRTEERMPPQSDFPPRDRWGRR